MKKTLLLFIIAFAVQVKAQITSRYVGLQTMYQTAEAVFEGRQVKKLPSFLDSKNQIFTPYEVTITKSIKNVTENTTVIIELEGGVYDGVDSKTSHGYNSLFVGKTLFFLIKNERNNYQIISMVNIENPLKIQADFTDTYKFYYSLNELYSDLSIISSTTISTGMKSIEELKINQPKGIEAYNNYIRNKLNLRLGNQQARPSTTEDLTLQITNGTITGSSIQYYEFDIKVSCNNNLTYLDNVPVWLTYNTSVFGFSVATNNNITVTSGAGFTNVNYLPANTNLGDDSPNTVVFNVGTDYNLSNPIRTQITTSYINLAHVKIKISNCGSATVNLSNAATAINGCFYTSTANASSSSFLFYDNLLYSGSLSTNINCSATVTDFNSPINGGLNQTLTIKGYSFGASRGNGQVKFRNADATGFPLFNKLDNMDYLSWSDTLIQIRFPSAIDTIVTGNLNTPGSGFFKVITNAGDSALSTINSLGFPFQVYYSIYNTRPVGITGISSAQKLKLNLYKVVPSTGGYIIRLDSSISNHPDRLGCVKKAVKDWVCLTAVNIKFGPDSNIQAQVQDKICHFYFTAPSNFPSSSVVASTRNLSSVCPSTPNVRLENDFDVKINRGKTFFYDTTGAALPNGNIDFYEVMLHEIGHGIGMCHVIDSSAVMYYRTLGNQPIVIPGSNRRHLVPYTSDVDGGDNQVSTSVTNITGQCGLQDMTLINSGSCSALSVKELSGNNFNAIIYPNPSIDGRTSITFDAIPNSKPVIEVYDLIGKNVFSDMPKNSYNDHYNYNLDLNNLVSGIYILKIKMANHIASFKIVKQ